jgi:tRNA uridine 5-carbamoylmethylation protein Kti12
MKIILLSGKPNTGKSTTLNLLYDKLTKNGVTNIITNKSILGNPVQKDFECVVTYNNKNIAIFSMGDYYGPFIDAIIKYSNCYALILAYNETFAKKLDKIIGSYSHHCVIKKSSSNVNDCEKIIAELES